MRSRVKTVSAADSNGNPSSLVLECLRVKQQDIRGDTQQITGETIMGMQVEIRDNKLCIEIDLEKPMPSSSGKTLVVASTRGNTVTTALVDGKPVIIGLNAYIKP
jgi:hypothetical protein